MEYGEYLWIFIIATFVAVFVAWGIGANDVANAFATSVGAKALTMKQAIVVAALCEFLGAVLLGAAVADTIKSNIAKLSAFQNTPDVFMMGMLCVMIVTGTWLALATFLELPVSTSHTVVGSVVGMTLALRGFQEVIWEKRSNTFPFTTGMTGIILSWVISPVIAGVIAVILFLLLRTFVLRSQHSYKRSFMVLPMVLFLTFFIITIFIIQVGGKNKTFKAQTDGTAAWIAAIVAGVASVAGTLMLVPLIKRTVAREEYERHHAAAEEGRSAANATENVAAKEGRSAANTTEKEPSNSNAVKDGDVAEHTKVLDYREPTWSKPLKKIGYAITHNLLSHRLKNYNWYKALMASSNADVHACVEEDVEVAAVHANAEKFDLNTERTFAYVQVFTAMTMAFAHGSNDVANSIGPYAAIYNIWRENGLPKTNTVPEWILVLGALLCSFPCSMSVLGCHHQPDILSEEKLKKDTGGAGIVLGVATYGYKIIRVLGVKSIKLTNSRGFCVELAAAITVVIASRYGLPVSTTQTLTGAVLAVGLIEGVKGVSWKQFAKIFAGWVATLVFAILLSAALSSVFMYSPNLHASDDNNLLYKNLNLQTQTMIGTLSASNMQSANYNSSLVELQQNLRPMAMAAFQLQNKTFTSYSGAAQTG